VMVGRTKPHGAARVVSLDSRPHVPAVRVMRFDPRKPPVLPGLHAHDHLVLALFERDGGWLRSPAKKWDVRAGDTFVVGPGEPVDAGGLGEATGWGAFFSPLALSTAEAIFAWQAHPLLHPFATGHGSHPLHGTVPVGERAWWSDRFRELDVELRDRRPGYSTAAVAQLTLLLVAVSRVFEDVAAHFRADSEPLLAEVFSAIEQGFRDGLGLREVAGTVGLTPGYLTTVVRRRTGRTVQTWISERRMAEARQDLAGTDRSVDELAHGLGYADAPHFIRQFKRRHGATPAAWRRLARGA
jgi:AraC family transcriptional regulator, transcriptional activator of pobA